MAGPVDPWDWTVDDLVANLCKSRRLWQGRPSSILPDPIALEHSLRENSMDGATMLSYVDDSIIREVLGVRPFAMRGAVRYAIEKLRSASHKYAEYTENQRSANAQDGYLSSHSATTHPDPHPNDPASSVPHEDNKSLPPLDDDSDTESFSASVWEEIQRDIEEDEEVKTQVERETLTSDEVEDIIDRKIEELVEAWKRKKLPLREKGAWSLWKRSRHPQSRSKLQKYFAQEVERLNERLARLRKGILDELWRKATDLERQGEIFEETIYQREDCVWRLSVLAQKTAPQRRNRPLKTITSRRQANPRENAEDSEELGSDSVASTDDNPEDFIEPDEDRIEMDVDIPSLVDKTLTNGEFSQPHQHPTVAHSSSPQIKESPSHQVEVKSSDPVTIIDLTSDRGNETDKASQSGTAATSHASMAIPAMASTSEVAKWAWSELEEKNDPLIQNWLNELRSWVPVPYEENIGHICHVDADQTVSERIRTVDSWCSSKGILMMSYDMFRILVSRKDKQKDKSREDDKTLTEISRQLLNGPDVVVADEAHFLKNPGSNISQYASQIRTKSRIALTGSPLSNSLREYYAMINWIAPGYLGNPIEFKAKYQEPIEMGLYKDSSHADWRYALKSLRILEKNIGPKLDRKDFADVESQLPRKVEFVLTVPFHDVQREAYKRFVECQEAGIMTQKTINLATLWAWLTAISLLVNHPFIFLEKLKDRHSQALRAEGSRENSDDEIPANPDQQEENPSIWKSILADDAIDQQIRALQTISDLKDPRFSPKMALLLQIVRLSKEAGDKVLVFSHSIPTLNYIEALLQRESELIYERLDGKTKVSDRQNMANNFNEGRVDLFLISTRAGGQGFNLQGANRVVIFDFAFNPGWETQAIGRAYRITQKKPVFVYRFIAGEGYEAELYKTAAYKTQLAYRVVDKINPVRASSKPSDYLFSPRPIKKNDVQGLRGKDPKVLDKLLDSAGSLIFDLATTDTLREEADEKLTKEEEQEAENEYQRRLQEKNPATLAPGANQLRLRPKHLSH
ncbi:P-loop containing nucleoside triphosphate hydrolase protein [Lineolata rhizophorae]|uniref:P-loop containing nucleoside triphosphate hydrolase protein n=1 Tax=Lineolata rhizophorae TaxID=578093 RepID=A0A6A6NZK9_9PEZI|nr:P-loop containing nucleoside triphosphate hydrolase protein [Lineolata rhizophorae]